MKNSMDLTEGNIAKKLIKLAIPIMGTSFIQMAYNLTDMIWLGNYSENAVSGVGTASFFTWFGMSFVLISKIGAEVGVSQAVGKKDEDEAKSYINSSVNINVILSILYGIILIMLRKDLIGFFNLGNQEVISMANTFLIITSLGICFNFINPVLSGIFNGLGDSKIPFYINTFGLIYNMLLDPVLIFGVGPIPALGVAGAAIATSSAQFFVTILFIIALWRKDQPYLKISLLKGMNFRYVKKIVKLGLPVALQNGLFSFFAMVIARIIAPWGTTAIAVQKVGSQIEAISWMTAGGFSSALSAFVGQNYGAKKWDRIYRGYIVTLSMAVIVGILATVLLVFAGRILFALFIPTENAIKMGTEYLKILGYSQLFMCIEITTSGAFNGLGKTIIPSVVSIIFTGLRIPLAIFLSSKQTLGLDGVWWSISISSVIKGIMLIILFYYIILIPKRKNIVPEIAN